MNWFDKIQQKMTADDGSPELKPGAIKPILLTELEKNPSGFVFDSYKGRTYVFIRTRPFRQLTVYEVFHVLFSLKERNFSCSVASYINPDYIYDSAYHGGFINQHVDLISLKGGTGATSIEEAYYYHNGREKTVTETVQQAFSDFNEHGIPWLERQYFRMERHDLIQTGFDLFEQLDYDKATLKQEIQTMNEHPVYTALKEKLQQVPHQEREDRKEIPRLASHLVQLYWTLP